MTVVSLAAVAAFALVSWIRRACHRDAPRQAPGATRGGPERSPDADVRVRNRQAAWRLRC